MEVAETHCAFHRRHAAIWLCRQCNLPLCGECIPGGEDNFRPGQPRCPDCLQPLDYLGYGGEREPFWRVAPRLFAYAAHWPLLLMAFLAGLLSHTLFLVDLFFYVVLIRYGLMVIERIAHGDMTPPSLGNAMQGDLNLFFRQIAVLAVMFVAPGLLLFVSPLLALLLLALVMLAIPASIMILAMTESFLQALNPAFWARLMWTIGWSYLLLWLALMSVTSAPEMIAALPISPAWHGLAQTLVGFASFYTGVVGYAMMGYQLYEHGRELGLGAMEPRGRNLPQDQYYKREALGLSHIYAQQGKREQALQAIDKALNYEPGDEMLNERRFRLLRLDPERPAFRRFADQYLRLLVSKSRDSVAATVLVDVLKALPDYRPADADIRLALAKVMVERGRWREAKILLVNLHSSHPAFKQLGEAYLLLARVYLEGSGKTDQAAKIFSFLRQHQPGVLNSDDGRALIQLYQRLRSAS